MALRPTILSIWRLPLICGLLFLSSYHIAYLLAAAAGHVEWCFPYLQGCTSISGTGRQPPEELVFKGLMMPGLVLGILYWVLSRRWLLSLGCISRRRLMAMSVLGVAGSLMLMMYVVALGEYGDTYRMMRRTGVNLGGGFSYLAQLLMFGMIRQPQVAQRLAPKLLRLWTVHVWLFLILGLLAQLCKGVVADDFYRRYLEDPLEWNLIGLLSLHYFVTFNAWKSTGFAITIESWQKQ